MLIRSLFMSVFFVATALAHVAHAAPAAAPPAQAEADEEEEAPAAVKEELPSDPSGKLYENFAMSRGFFISSDVGMVWAFGSATRVISNTQVYVGLNIGYDINQWFSWQVHVGRGFSAAAPRSPNQIGRIEDFGWTNLQTGPVLSFLIWERLAFELKALGGVALLDTAPLDAADGVTMGTVAANVGGGLGLKYLTLLTDVTIGFEAQFGFIIGPNIPVLSVAPLVVRYTF